MNMLRVTPGHVDDYYNDFRASLKRQLDEAKREGLVLSYKIISTDATKPGDWNALVMVEYKNMAALDRLRKKMEPIATQTVGSPGRAAGSKPETQRAPPDNRDEAGS